VEAFWSPALFSRLKIAGKSSRYINRLNYRVTAGEDLSLSGGASIQSLAFFKLSITSLVLIDSPETNKGDPLGSPSLQAAMPPYV
jgi:hypothetical protein